MFDDEDQTNEDTVAKVPAQTTASTFDLENTVKTLPPVDKYLKRADQEFEAQESERPQYVKRMEARSKSYDQVLDDLSTRTFDEAKPTFDVPNFKAPEPQADPIKAFGSFGSVLGILASAFTRKPLQNSIMAMTAVNQAEQAADKTAYDHAWNEYQTATKVALEKIGFEKQMYQNAIDIYKTDNAKGIGLLNGIAAQMQNEKLMFAAKHDPAMALSMASNMISAYDKWSDANDEIQNRHLVNQHIEEKRQEAIAAGRPFTAADAADAKNDILQQIDPKWARANSGTPNRASEMIRLNEEEKKEVADAEQSLSGPELAARKIQIKAKFDEERRRLYAPKDVVGAADIGKDIRAIDDAMPRIEAMEALVDYNPEIVGVRARTNQFLGAVVGQLGKDISNEAARVNAVRQIAGTLEGPMSRLYTGSGQWSKAKSELLGSINPATGLLTTPDQFHNAINFLKGDLATMRERRQGQLDRAPGNPTIAPLPGVTLPPGIPPGSKKIGTKDGNDVYQTPDGKRLMVTK